MDDIFTRSGIPSDPILMLAPMEGVTNGLFRDLICEIGSVDLVATEFIRITAGNQKLSPFHRHTSPSVPLQIQLMANDPNSLTECIEHLHQTGILLQNDWLDLNVGCPSKKVNASGAGAALLKDPPRLLKIIEGMRKKHSGPLSIKTRPAFDDLNEFPELLRVLKKAPLDFITLHARARGAVHAGPVHHDLLKMAVEELPYPVIGNGDIWSALDAKNMIDATGVRGVMCGRGVLRNPLLLRDIREEFSQKDPLASIESRRAELIQFIDHLAQRYTDAGKHCTSFCGTFKEFSGWVSKNDLIGKEYFEAIKRQQTMSDLHSKAREFLSKSPTATCH